jgi:hypothetical protein
MPYSVSVGDSNKIYVPGTPLGLGKFRVNIDTPTQSGGGGEDNSFTTLSGPLTCGSIYFDGTQSNSTARYSPWGGFNFGTGPFTVEWWQQQGGENHSHVRPFNFGTYPSQSFGVSYEGGFYGWFPNANYIGPLGTYKNQWVHFAITRLNGVIKVFKNGTQIGSNLPNTNDIQHTSGLTIGNEESANLQSQFGGFMTNFHVMLAAKYTANFVPDATKPIPPTTKTIFLMDCDDSGNAMKDYTNINSGYGVNIVWNSANPFGF